jgi:hypothetical protein
MLSELEKILWFHPGLLVWFDYCKSKVIRTLTSMKIVISWLESSFTFLRKSKAVLFLRYVFWSCMCTSHKYVNSIDVNDCEIIFFSHNVWYNYRVICGIASVIVPLACLSRFELLFDDYQLLSALDRSLHAMLLEILYASRKKKSSIFPFLCSTEYKESAQKKEIIFRWFYSMRYVFYAPSAYVCCSFFTLLLNSSDRIWLCVVLTMSDW